MLDPESGALIPGTGGLRKVRWQAEGRGKRGGHRVIYYYAVAPQVILMLFMYPTNEQDDLTPAQKRALRELVEQEFQKRRPYELPSRSRRGAH